MAVVGAALLAGCTGGEGRSAPTTAVAGAPSTTSAVTSSAPSTTTPPTADPVGPLGLVDTLRVRAAESETDLEYRRAAFSDDWDYDPTTGCNIRERVLIEESLVPPDVDDRCRSTNGRWVSRYDGVETTDVADLEIDHLVALADAWRSGAAAWTAEERYRFANDLSAPETLIAVTSATNRSKGDSPPDRWLPPDRSAWCAYARDWVAVKARWDLSVTAAEKSTLVSVLSGCPVDR